jgi:hypothetical protein
MTDEQSTPEDMSKWVIQRMITILIAAAILILLAFAIPVFVRARNSAAQNACLDNIRLIKAANVEAAERGQRRSSTIGSRGNNEEPTNESSNRVELR